MRAYGAREGIAGMYGAGDSGRGCVAREIARDMADMAREIAGRYRERGIAPRL